MVAGRSAWSLGLHSSLWTTSLALGKLGLWKAIPTSLRPFVTAHCITATTDVLPAAINFLSWTRLKATQLTKVSFAHLPH
jgi:hypothetical protein